MPSFDRYYSQLQSFYDDYRCALHLPPPPLPTHQSAGHAISTILQPSPREHPVRGLQLIRLLTQNRIADFHTALESLPLPADEIADDPYISHPVNLERWLMEGSYSKVWNAREDAPTEEYEFFVDSLMSTIRFVPFCVKCVGSS